MTMNAKRDIMLGRPLLLVLLSLSLLASAQGGGASTWGWRTRFNYDAAPQVGAAAAAGRARLDRRWQRLMPTAIPSAMSAASTRRLVSLRGGSGAPRQPPLASSAPTTCRNGVSENKREDAEGLETSVDNNGDNDKEKEEERTESTQNGLCLTRLDGADDGCGGDTLRATVGRLLSPVAVEKGAGRQGTREGRVVVATEVRGGMVASLITRAFHIQRHELSKFLYMSFMMFAIIYVFTMTRDTKDTLIITNCGAEAIAFLKVYAVLPAAALFMVGYNWLSNHVGSRALFHLTITPFFAFYAVFAFVMYPMRGVLHHAAGAMEKDEHVFSHMINIGRFWMFSLYYVVSELWGSAGVPLLFWTCANEVTPISQAKRFYPLFAILGNLAPIASGQTMAYVSRNRPAGLDPDMAFERTLKILSGLILGVGGSIMFLYEIIMGINRREAAETDALKTKSERRRTQRALLKSAKQKMGLLESFRFLSQSKYLGYVGLVVVSYGLSMEFTEIVWKAIVKLAYPDKSDYMAFMGQYSTIVGASTFVMLLVGKEVIKYLGWEVGALATPVMMALLAVPFFGYITLGDIQQSKKTLMLAVWVGMVQNVLSKATKYALFDPTKEMAYIPLDKESKVKGKAAIDVLGARLGKSGGALAQQGLVVVCGSIISGAPVLATMFALVSAMWITSVLKLGKLFKVKQAEAEKLAASEGAR